ncbi:hypothetical protein [Alkalihalobacillus pseudalcaliphilus]|uniref:hypothetical protein n=1 Tax=Alkalihalobacillus pseudalcaliphilus TaxID=79884 RepID=UPI00064D7CD8|nr:hypothetical protein [Alkalihalobacillus pseudalcaliphilus]KMK74407.1 hypothetical protein AB990_21090 [Alkalihalobacillus pseudalcaliphilus]
MRKDILVGCVLTVVFLLLTIFNFPEYHLFLLALVWSLDYTATKLLGMNLFIKKNWFYLVINYLAVLSPFIYTVIYMTSSFIKLYALYFFIFMIVISFIIRFSSSRLIRSEPQKEVI